MKDLCVRPLWPTILASLHVIYKGVGKAAKALQEMQSSKSPVTPRSKRTRGQTNKGANEQGGNNEPHLCVFCLKDENQIPGDVFVRQVLITLKRLS